MMDPQIDPRIDALIDAYIDHAMDDNQFDALCTWLREDADHRKIFARRLATHASIAECCTERSGHNLAGNLTSDVGAFASSTIDETEKESDKLTKQQYVAAVSYVLRHTFTPKRVATLAAAALLLGMAIAIVMFTGPDEPDRTAQVPDQSNPIEDLPANTSPVATITATHNATWSPDSPEGASVPGTQLRAGQRLTLTAGFAEITTTKGAKAILEAPATVEVLDNAMRLHAGKLVGKITTPQAKGFTVYTPNMRAVDIGTEFGVSTDHQTGTQVHVFHGEVVASALERGEAHSQALILRASQAATLDMQLGEVVAIDFEPELFERRILKRLNLIDLIAGGSGSGAPRDIGLHPLTGRLVTDVSTESITASYSSDGRARPVPGTPFVASTFVPAKDQPMRGLPAGLDLKKIAISGGRGFGMIWCGGPMPKFNLSFVDEIPLTFAGRPLSESGDTIIMHANAAVVLDLDAIRERYPGFRVSGLKARVANTSGRVEAGDEKDYRAAFQAFAGNRLAFQADFKRSLPIDQHIHTIDLSLQADDRYLTLISTDGGDAIFRDWLVLADPILELTTD